MFVDDYEDFDFELEEKEVEKVVKASTRVKGKISVPWSVHQRIVRAIVLIHHQARYFEGMSILCSLAGFKPRCLENEFDSLLERKKVRDQFNQWVKSFT